MGALKLIGSAFNAFSALVNKAAIKEEEQEGPKLKLSFIMWFAWFHIELSAYCTNKLNKIPKQ